MLLLFPAVFLPGRLAAAPTNASPVAVFLVLEGDPACLAAGGAKSARELSLAAGNTKLRLAELNAKHAALQPQITALGGLVLSHHTRLINAIKVRVAPDQLAALAALPGVKKVSRVHLYKRGLIHTVPFSGTPAAWSSLSPSADGAGVRIGIIDTGIDYTHADFGGSGTPAYYNSIDPTRLQPGVFPTAKVVGGYDLAGDSYDAADPDNSISKPDPNPLDCAAGGGHGTHVAGIAAGLGVLTNGQSYTGPYTSALDFSQFRVGPGVAPGAFLYAIKIFSCVVDGRTALVADALEWASDPNGDGNFSDHLDVVNMSLGSTFGDNDPEDPDVTAANNLSQLGCVVVCSAGNDYNIFYADATPGSASRAISVGASVVQGVAEGIQALSPASIAGNYRAVEGAFTAPLSLTGPVTGTVVYIEPNDACNPIQNAAALKGNIALIDRGTCFFVDKIQAAQDAGAIAAIVVDNTVEIPFSMGGTSSTITIPGVMISKADGAAIKAQLPGVRVLMSASITVNVPQNVDNLQDFSSRGPVALTSFLKPEIVAPGADIVSAAAGTGTNGISFSGTSMASPHVGGAAAILRQLHPAWSVEEIKAALMNTTISAHNSSGVQYAESRQGAGRIQVDQAAKTAVTAVAANVGGNVAISLGSLILASPFQTNATIILSNHGSNAATFQLAVSNTLPQTGFAVVPGVPSVTVPAQGSTNVVISFAANPAQFTLAPDPSTAAQVDGYAQQVLNEASGQIWFLGAQSIHLPYYANLRAASTFHAQTNRAVLPPNLSTQRFVTNNITFQGVSANTNPMVSAFELGATLENPHLLDPIESYANLVAVGAASDIATAGSVSNASLYFGLATATSWPTPQPGLLTLQILIDTNNDGQADFILQNGTLNDINADASALDVFVTTVQNLDSNSNVTNIFFDDFLNYYTPDQADTAPYNNNVLVEAVYASDIGLSDGFSRFRYQVVSSGFFANVSQTGWITFDAANPTIDTAANSPDGSPFWNDGQPVLSVLDRAAAANTGQRVPSVLLLHHHNVEGARVDYVHVDLVNDDINNNGLPDWWETQYFHNLTTATRSTDFDHDGMSDYDEYLAGTDPTDPKSYLRMISGVPVLGQGTIVSWTSAGYRTYTLFSSADLSAGFSPVAGGLIATPPVNQFLDTSTTSGPVFYRVQVMPPK